MATKYARQIAGAQAKMKARGQLVKYTQVVGTVTPNDPSKPFVVGTPTGVDPNANKAPVDTYMVFLDAKARGSSTQGMAAEFVKDTDIVGGNKLGLLAGGQGIDVKIGDLIDRNSGTLTGYPIYKVAKIKILDVDGAPILYTLELEV